MVYWNNADIEAACYGGAMIALATTLNLWLFGKLTGISGMLHSVIRHDRDGGFYWKYSFLMGLVSIPFIMEYVYGSSFKMFGRTFIMFDSNASVNARLNLLGWIIAGLLVGFGTRMGNGCTSGHGVCGIPRLSRRSITATITFMASGMLMATFRGHFPFLSNSSWSSGKVEDIYQWIALPLYCIMGVFLILFLIQNWYLSFIREYLLTFVFGNIFGLGLMISGMCRISKVIGFLTIDSNWDPTLAFVMATAVGINLITFFFLMKGSPVYAGSYDVPNGHHVDSKLILGAFIFGIGWGIAGLCPGPGLINLFVLPNALIWVFSVIVGQVVYDLLHDRYHDDYVLFK
jgi:hypothetical protein